MFISAFVVLGLVISDYRAKRLAWKCVSETMYCVSSGT